MQKIRMEKEAAAVKNTPKINNLFPHVPGLLFVYCSFILESASITNSYESICSRC